MKNPEKEHRWKEYCKSCKKKHFMHVDTCPSCGVYEIVDTVSEILSCGDYECAGCEAYRDRY